MEAPEPVRHHLRGPDRVEERTHEHHEHQEHADPPPADAPSPRVSAGLGVIPRIVRDGAEIYRGKLGREEADDRLAQLYRPYHAALAALMEETRARFGMVLRGAKSNPRRMIALGFPIQRYQLTAFVISAAMCSVAGALLANQLLFVSPAIMTWERSGELMIMVILGGVSSLFGSILGAAIYLVLEHELSALTSHWLVILGPLMILIVLFAKRGVFGLLKETGHG